LAPIAGLIGSLVPQSGNGKNPLQGISDMKPTLIAAYGEHTADHGGGQRRRILQRRHGQLLSGNLSTHGGIGVADGSTDGNKEALKDVS
jgi:hypothetical protein